MKNKIVLSCNPKFSKLALNEVKQFDNSASIEFQLGERSILVLLQKDFSSLSDYWKNSKPIFVQHVLCVLDEININLNIKDLHLIAEIVQKNINTINASKSFSVQTRLIGDFLYTPLQINNEISNLIRNQINAELNIKNPQQFVSILCNGDNKKCYIGISNVSQNLSKWSGGITRYKIEENQVSRAELKLLEAIDTFNINLLEGDTALDLGASPGGWSRILANKGLFVIAIDPAELDSKILSNKKIKHNKITAQEYFSKNKIVFNLIVNDMKKDPQDSAILMNKYAKFLNKSGIVIMTLKLPSNTNITKKILASTFNILQKEYVIKSAMNLFYNRNEVTLYLEKKN